METHEVEVRLPSIAGYEKLAMNVVADIARMMGLPSNRIDDLKTAVSEAVLNAMEHGNHFDPGLPVIVAICQVSHQLQIQVHDEGRGIGKRKKVSRNMHSKNAAKEQSRGFGLFLIEHFVDEVEFCDEEGKGCCVKMMVHLGAIRD